MPREKTTLVYRLGELDNRAKERARDKAREWACQDDWYEYTYEDAERMFALLGITLDQRTYRTMGGGTGSKPAIYFSGFSSQGDGACFEGRYEYRRGAAVAIRQEAPTDTRLHQIADRLQAIQRPAFYRLRAHIQHNGHHYHEYCALIDVYDGSDNAVGGTAESELSDCLRDLMRWIYRRLEAEYEYQTSDEAIDEMIEANEYEFTENGTLA